jgi:hypothetical protein
MKENNSSMKFHLGNLNKDEMQFYTSYRCFLEHVTISLYFKEKR